MRQTTRPTRGVFGTPTIVVSSLLLALLTPLAAGAGDHANTPASPATSADREFESLLASLTDGRSGCYLKQVDGPILIDVHADAPFEPASAIKVLHHLHALLAVQRAELALDTPIAVHLAAVGSCPIDALPAFEPLRDVLRSMMEESDNRRAQAIRAHFGDDALNATAQVLGMHATALRHRIGCAAGDDGAVARPNRATLADLARLYESAAALLTPEHHAAFLDLMIDSRGEGLPLALEAIIEQEQAGADPDTRAAFKARVRSAHKGGNYAWTIADRAAFDHARAGWITLPFRTATGEIIDRAYVLGVFVNDATHDASAATAVARVYSRMMREPIRAALASWSAWVDRCRADLDDGSGQGRPDGAVTIDDLAFFLDRFAASDPAADLDDGHHAGLPDGEVTIDDLMYFLARFERGC